MNQNIRLRSRTIFAAGLAIALGSLGIYLYPARLAGQVPSGTDPHPIRALQEERLATLRTIVEIVDQKRRQGGASMAELAAAKREVAEAELEVCANPADRVKVLERIVADARIIADKAAQLAQDNLISQELALAMKAELLRSQIRLELARAGLSSELNGSDPKRAPAGYATAPSK